MNAHLIKQFKRFDEVGDDEVLTAVVEDVVAELRRGNDILAKQILAIINNQTTESNIRCSAMETFNAANPKKYRGDFIEALWHILRRDDENEDVQRTAIAIYPDRSQDERRILREHMKAIVCPCGHRGKLAEEILEQEIEQDAL